MTTHDVVIAAWWVLVAAFVGCELAARLGRHVMALRALIALLVSRPWRRYAVLVGWMWLGWHFFAR